MRRSLAYQFRHKLKQFLAGSTSLNPCHRQPGSGRTGSELTNQRQPFSVTIQTSANKFCSIGSPYGGQNCPTELIPAIA